MRTMLVALDNVIDPGLSTITWLSLNLDQYLLDVDTVSLYTKKRGLNRDLNPGPLAPKARIIPLDH
jgi:hypothetical protein